MNLTIVAFLVAVLIIAGLLVVVMMVTRRAPGPVDVNRFRSKWLSIEQQLIRDNDASYVMTILNADKLLDQALKARGFKGETMGERMKSARPRWSNANVVWSAHKLRNRIAHEDKSVSFEETRTALAGFKSGLKDLGVI